MSFEIRTTSYFDVEAKRLVKRHHSFIDNLGFDLAKLQREGNLRVPDQLQ